MPKVFLVVDDLEDVQRFFGRWLPRFVNGRNGGAQILQAQTLEEARRLFQENEGVLSAIIMDGQVDQPERETIRLVQEIRSRWPGPIVAISGHSAIQEQMVAAGCDYQLPKPFPIEQLKTIIGKIIE